MGKIGLFLSTLLICANQLFAQETLYVEYPDVVFNGTAAKVVISDANDSIPAYIVQINKAGQLDTILIEKKDDVYSFTPVFYNEDDGIQLKNYELKGEEPAYIPLWTSILPPLIAILLALVFKEVIFSLISGIFIGGAIMGFYAEGFAGIFTGFFSIIDTYLINALNNPDHLSVILFSVIIGGIVAIISKNGGMQGIVNSIARFANNARNGQLATWALGIAIFFDDYANTLVVGNTMRAVTDKLRISREKLAYIVDSTAAPVSAIAFVTTWIGAELGYIQSGVNSINSNGGEISEGVYSIFLSSLSYSFYPILTLFFIFWLVYRGKDYGSMLKAEKRARTGEVINPEENMADMTELKEIEPEKGIKYRAFNAVIPVAIIVFGTLIGLVYTGFESLHGQLASVDETIDVSSWGRIWSNMHLLPEEPSTFTQRLGTLIGSSNSYLALLWASLSSLLVAIFMTIGQRIMSLQKSVETAITGFKAMLPAVLILILAWALATVTEEMHTAEYLTGILGETVPAWLIPGLTFVLAGFVAFSTGSSWSTMALVYPLILPAAWAICQAEAYEHADAMAIFYNTVSAVLAGSVLGDHCSPISDTTILSSLASGCNHIDHVRTQIPYALTVGGIAVLVGTVPSALGLPPLLSMLMGIGACILVIELIGKKTEGTS